VDQYPVFSKFEDVFPKYFLGLPPKRELDFTIELKSSAEPISKTLYRIITHKICELQM